MTPSERELIHKLAEGLRTTDRSAIDTEAERFIRSEVAGQPNAAYLLTQRVIVQELALSRAQARIAELEAQVRAAPGGQAARGGSFLGGASGGGSYPPAAGYAPPAPGYSPQAPGYAPAPGPAPAPAAQGPAAGGGAGGFLKTAAAAAAGTVAGQLIFDGVRHMAAGHGGGLGGLLPGSHPAPAPSWGGDSGRTPSGGYLPADRRDDSRSDAGGGGDFGSDRDEAIEDPITDDDEVVEADDPETDAGGGGSFLDDADAGGGGDFGDDNDPPDAGGGADW